MKHLYITFKEQLSECLQDSEGNYLKDLDGNYIRNHLTPLGYAAEYREGNEKTEKKNRDQDKWAYSSRCLAHVVRDGLYYHVQRKWDPVTDVETLARHQPRIIENVPVRGFKIAKTVTRSSTSNKLWRILDPRGFELEISTANMEDILMNGTVKNGELIGSYIWDFGKNGIDKAHLIKVKA